MELGAFSVSLAVKDIKASRAFYEKIGFTVFHGEEAHNYLIMRNGAHVIGLFQGMFDKNIMAFNPGWDQDCNTLSDFADVRKLQAHFKAQGLKVEPECEPDGSGPGSCMLQDPDGNTILIDQHV